MQPYPEYSVEPFWGSDQQTGLGNNKIGVGEHTKKVAVYGSVFVIRQLKVRSHRLRNTEYFDQGDKVNKPENCS